MRARTARLASEQQRSRKAIKRLQQSKRRLKKQNAELKSVLKTLTKENILLREQVSVLDTLGAANQHLLKRQIAKQTGQHPRKYSPELRAFALTLNFYSPRAYQYVREVFDTCLPHPRTLRKWYESVEGKAGFSKEAVTALKLKCLETSSRGHQAVCSLIVDEMSIRQQVQWQSGHFEGYVDMGAGTEGDCLPQAKAAFVIMAVSINGHWKVPLGYFLVDGLVGEQRANLVRQSLLTAHEAGAMIVSLTCDGAPANIAMLQELGCNFADIQNLQTTFKHPATNEPVAAFLDPCHMLKLVRNAFAHHKYFINQDGKVVSWAHIEALHDLQDKEGVHLANKLRRAHIEWQRQPMKVRLAAQVMSLSVATAIAECRAMCLRGFANSEATEEFLVIINNLFDILNSRSMHQGGWKKPVNEQNVNNIKELFDSTIRYLSLLKEPANRRNLIETGRKTGFLGFIICMNSLLAMYDFLICKKKILKYIPGHKICQDHLELFFGLIRAHGGHNDNPTSQQFQAAFKKVIVQNELSDVVSGNCQVLDRITILSCSSTKRHSATELLNATIQRRQLLSEETVEHSYVVSEHDYCASFEHISDFGSRAVAYIAGYVANKLGSKLMCAHCSEALFSTSGAADTAFIQRKSRGALHYPSKSVLEICKKSESLLRWAVHMKMLVSRSLLQDLVLQVLESLQHKQLFAELHTHMFDNSPLENHYVHLLRSVAESYLNVRLYHVGKQTTQSFHSSQVRQMFTKLTQFKGQ